MLQSLCTWRCLKAIWKWSWAPCCRCPLLVRLRWWPSEIRSNLNQFCHIFVLSTASFCNPTWTDRQLPSGSHFCWWPRELDSKEKEMFITSYIIYIIYTFFFFFLISLSWQKITLPVNLNRNTIHRNSNQVLLQHICLESVLSSMCCKRSSSTHWTVKIVWK